MARLPIPGSDAGEWGNILNEYLSTSHRPDGTLKNGVVQESNISASAKASLQGMQASTYDPNDVQADVYDRANHTGTQPASSVSGLATVATSGSYDDLSNQPTIPTKTSDLTNDDGFISSGDIPVTSVNARTGAVTGLAEASDLTAHTSNTSNPHNVTKAQVGLGNVDNTADANKNVLSATKLTTARNIAGVPFDGTANIAIPSANITDDEYTTATTPHLQQARFDITRGDRTAFLPADQIIIEQSTDAGATWTDAGVSDDNKRKLFTGQRPGIYIPLKGGVRNTDCMTRITITAMKYNVPGGTAETDKYNYWNSSYVLSTERYCTIQAGWVWLNSNWDRIYMKYETATGASPNSWSNRREAFMAGWSGDNYFSVNGYTAFGGYVSQTSNPWNHRLTFRTCTTSNDFDNGKLSPNESSTPQYIQHIKTVGRNIWAVPNNYAYNDHLYSWDVDQNATFPASISATSLALNSSSRGYNIAITTGETTKAISFATAQPNANYAVFCSPNWDTSFFVTDKSTTGFTLNFGTPAPSNQLVDWMIVK